MTTELLLDVDVAPAPVLATVVADQALMDAFRKAMAERKRIRAGETVVNELFDEDDYTAVTPIVDQQQEGSHEPPAGFGYDFGDAKPSVVGGYIPEPSKSYALRRVKELRSFMEASPTVEPTDWTLEEFERINKYNLELVETKRAEKKGG